MVPSCDLIIKGPLLHCEKDSWLTSYVQVTCENSSICAQPSLPQEAEEKQV